jgi:hypothetical protein
MKNFLPKTLQSALLCLLIAAMFALVVRVFVSTGRLESRVGETTSAAQTLVLEAQGFIAGQRGLAEENRKSLEAAYQVGAVFNGTGRLLNRSVLPRVMKNLDSADVLLATLNENAVTLNRTIANLDTRVSGDKGVLDAAIALIRTIDGTAERLGVTAGTLDRMLGEIGARANLSLDSVYELISSPQWHQALQNLTIVSGNVARTSEKVDATVEQVRLAMLNAPEIADSLNRIAKASSKYVKITLLANLLLVLSRAFLP